MQTLLLKKKQQQQKQTNKQTKNKAFQGVYFFQNTLKRKKKVYSYPRSRPRTRI